MARGMHGSLVGVLVGRGDHFGFHLFVFLSILLELLSEVRHGACIFRNLQHSFLRFALSPKGGAYEK